MLARPSQSAKLQPSREVLAQQDAEAWERYGQTCLNPLATEEHRAEAWDRAMDAFEALFELDRPLVKR